MLFQRIYNWIKYKTLPPSFLFKNRLFIERDSKHRRIFLNFGLNFRNSKWTNYENYNIQHNFRISFYKYILLFFFFLFLILLLKFKYYYIYYYVFNQVAFLVWSTIDSIDYYLSFLVWLISLLFSLFFNLFYSYFFFNNFSSQYRLGDFFMDELTDTTSNITSTNDKFMLAKKDYNWFLYSWISSDLKKNHITDNILEDLFNTKAQSRWWGLYNDFFIKLYKVVFFSNISSEKTTLFSLKMTLENIFSLNSKKISPLFLAYLNNQTLIKNYFSFISYFYLKNNYNYFEETSRASTSLRPLSSRYEWNLFNFNNELSKFSNFSIFKKGFFYLEDFNYGALNSLCENYSELRFLTFNIQHHLQETKWMRWLYRYSLLHRKILKNSHKLTLSKKLINSGFYSISMFDKNIWASSNLRKNSLDTLFSSLYRALYTHNSPHSHPYLSNFFKYNDNFSSLKFLNFYENSFFWTIKRYFFFNTFLSNFITSSFRLKNPSNYVSLNLNSHMDLNNYFLKSLKLSFNFVPAETSLFADNLTPSPEYEDFKLKDVLYATYDNDFFNKDNLNFIYWLLIPVTNNLNDLYFFNPFFFSPRPTYRSRFYNNSNISDLDYFFFMDFSLFDYPFLSDLNFLTYF